MYVVHVTESSVEEKQGCVFRNLYLLPIFYTRENSITRHKCSLRFQGKHKKPRVCRQSRTEQGPRLESWAAAWWQKCSAGDLSPRVRTQFPAPGLCCLKSRYLLQLLRNGGEGVISPDKSLGFTNGKKEAVLCTAL